MSKSDEARATNSVPAVGLSQVFGRVLEQLSVTAWLPAAVLVWTAAVLIELNTNDEAESLIEAINVLFSLGFEGIFGLALALIFATILIQPAEFSATAFLEGRWGNGRLSSCVLNPLFYYQRGKRRKHRDLLRNAVAGAQDSVKKERERWGRVGHDEDSAQKVKSEGNQSRFTAQAWSFLWFAARWLGRFIRCILAPSSRFARDDRGPDPEIDLTECSDPEILHRILLLKSRWDDVWPEAESRLMPTRLGNILRSAEDKMVLPEGEEKRRFVMRKRECIPAYLLAEHDSYRNRLDMYCIMTLICAVLAVASPVCLLVWEGSCVEAGCAGGLYALLAVAAYHAAAMSASYYGTILREIAGGRGSRAAPRL